MAVHAAVRALQCRECDFALVAAVNVMLTPRMAKNCAVAGMTSPTGRCHTFDTAADGYVRSEGCGCVLLHRSDSPCNSVHAMIQGVGVGQDGVSASLTAPNGRAQEKLIHKTLRDANLSASDVDYLEAHGTGTALGDPVEMSAIAAVIGNAQNTAGTLTMGAVKANIGHLEPGAGIAGLIKAVLVLQHEQSPPIAGLKTLNPKVTEVVQGLDVRFPTTLESLREHSGKEEQIGLIAGVSSFGFSGTRYERCLVLVCLAYWWFQ